MTAQPRPGIALPLQAAIGAADEDEAYYVYGVVPWPLDPSALPPSEVAGQAIDLAQPVYFLPFQDVAAIVRRVALTEFGPAALETNLQDTRWATAAVLAHQQVLDHVLTSLRARSTPRSGGEVARRSTPRSGGEVARDSGGALDASPPEGTLHTACPTPVPMKFCTIYRSEEGVGQALAGHYAELAAALARLAGKCEWGVKAYCDPAALGQLLADPDRDVGTFGERVRSLQAQRTGASAGAAYFVRKKLEAALAEATGALSDEITTHSHQRLAARADGAVANPPRDHDRSPNGRAETMVLNAAYLVADERLEAFRAELLLLEEEYGAAGFRYELTGPWAPYNFVAGPESEQPGAEERTVEATDGTPGHG